jgi:hypothetical protein
VTEQRTYRTPFYHLMSPDLPHEFRHILTLMLKEDKPEVIPELTQQTLYDSESMHTKFMRMNLKCFCKDCFKSGAK